MSKINARLRMAAVAVSALLPIVTSLAVSAFADSQVRVVRLSEVQGDVKIDRNLGQGYEKAFLNLPITQGVKLQTKNGGRAEVEFEDGSTLRITPDTVIEFPQLSLRDSGAKVSGVHLQEGTAYVNFAGAKDDEFTLTFAHEKLLANAFGPSASRNGGRHRDGSRFQRRRASRRRFGEGGCQQKPHGNL